MKDRSNSSTNTFFRAPLYIFFPCSQFKNLKNILFNFMKYFPRESARMIAAVFWLLPISIQLRKYAAGDIVPSLTRVKKHGSELKFFVSIFRKLNWINIIKSRKMVTMENREIFSNYYFSHLWDYKATLLGGN